MNSLRTRFIIAFLLIATIAIASIGTILTLQLRTALLNDTGYALQLQARAEASAIGEALDGQLIRLRSLALERAFQSAAGRQVQFAPSETAARERIIERDRAWPDLPNDDTLITSVIGTTLAGDLRNYAALDADIVELMVTDRRGALVAATARTSDYDQSDELWWQEASRRGVYVSPPTFDRSSNSFGLIMAVEMRDPRTDALLGVVRSTYQIDALIDVLANAGFGTTGKAELLLPAERLRLGTDSSIGINDEELQAITAAQDRDYALVMLDSEVQFLVLAPIDTSLDVGRLNWVVLLRQAQDEALAPINTAVRNALLTAGVVLLLALLAALVGAELLAGPIRRITAAAEQIADGDLEQRINLNRRDEIGRLAQNFDRMAASLEERMAAEQALQAERLQLQAEMIAAQEERIKELDVPAIPLGDRVLLLPLIGSVDTRRAESVMRTLLQDVASQRAETVLIDLSGTATLGAAEARVLIQTVIGVRLLGARACLIGLRPKLARTLIAIDADLRDVPVYANLQAALVATQPHSARSSPLQRTSSD